MRVRIQRGAEEIGGNCVDVATAGGRRIVLDAGLPLPRDATEGPPPVGGFRTPVGSPPVAVVVSHPHLDHYGLVPEIAPGVPVYVGREAAALLSAAAFFSPSPEGFVPTGFLRHREPLAIGPFTVTPYLVDHSAFDAYSMLIEADGLRLFYTGDLRGHGRKRTLFTQLLDRPPTGVDVLLMEGTHVRADASADEVVFPTEDELEDRFVEAIRATRGAVVVLASMQNLDRLVTVYRAGRRCGRETVLDLYGATVAAATRPTIPQPGFDHLRVYLSRRQRALVKRTGAFWRTDRIQPHRVFPEDLAADPGRYCLYMSCSTVRELVDVAALDGSGLAVWSMWPGYLSTPSGLVLQDLSITAAAEVQGSGQAKAPVKILLADGGHLSRDQLDELKQHVEEGIRARLEGPPPIHRRDEHWLQAVIRRDPTLVGIEQPALREMPAWRPRDDQPRWGRGFIDLIGMDGHGDIRIVETKLASNPDDLLILQGLDYYIWANAYRQVLIDRLGAPHRARIELHYAIGDAEDGTIKLSPFIRAQAEGLGDDVAWQFQTVSSWYHPRTGAERAQSDAYAPQMLPGPARETHSRVDGVTTCPSAADSGGLASSVARETAW